MNEIDCELQVGRSNMMIEEMGLAQKHQKNQILQWVVINMMTLMVGLLGLALMLGFCAGVCSVMLKPFWGLFFLLFLQIFAGMCDLICRNGGLKQKLLWPGRRVEGYIVEREGGREEKQRNLSVVVVCCLERGIIEGSKKAIICGL